jgi:hypothetical protein
VQNLLYKGAGAGKRSIEDSGDDGLASDEHGSPSTRRPMKKRRGLEREVPVEPQLRLLENNEKIDLGPLRAACQTIEDQVIRLQQTLEHERCGKKKLQAEYDDLSTAVHHATRAQQAWEHLAFKVNPSGIGLPAFVPPSFDPASFSAPLPFVSPYALSSSPNDLNVLGSAAYKPFAGGTPIPYLCPPTSDLMMSAITPGTSAYIKDTKSNKTLEHFFQRGHDLVSETPSISHHSKIDNERDKPVEERDKMEDAQHQVLAHDITSQHEKV